MSDSVWPHRRQPTSSPIPGILQARTLEWVAISFSNAWKWKVKVKLLSRLRLLATPWTAAYQAPLSMGFSRQEYWSGVPLPSLIPLYRCIQCFPSCAHCKESACKCRRLLDQEYIYIYTHIYVYIYKLRRHCCFIIRVFGIGSVQILKISIIIFC